MKRYQLRLVGRRKPEVWKTHSSLRFASWNACIYQYEMVATVLCAAHTMNSPVSQRPWLTSISNEGSQVWRRGELYTAWHSYMCQSHSPSASTLVVRCRLAWLLSPGVNKSVLSTIWPTESACKHAPIIVCAFLWWVPSLSGNWFLFRETRKNSAHYLAGGLRLL